MPLAAGRRLGPYEIVAAVGAAGMGEVYRARDTRLQRTVAIKVLSRHLASDPQFRERFDREVPPPRRPPFVAIPSSLVICDAGQEVVHASRDTTHRQADEAHRRPG